MRKLLANLPFLLALGIVVGFSTDLSVLRPLKTETTFGTWVVILVPAAIVLFLLQLVLWVRWPRTRPFNR